MSGIAEGRPVTGGASGEPRRPPFERWLGLLFVLLASALVPWTVYLAIELPRRAVSRHYDLAWVGFDVALVLVLAATAWSAMRRSRYLALTATSAATLLVVDAWFDVVTSPSVREEAMALVLAVLVELPLAALCIWWALHVQDVMASTVVFWRRRAREDGSAVGRDVGEKAAH